MEPIWQRSSIKGCCRCYFESHLVIDVATIGIDASGTGFKPGMVPSTLLFSMWFTCDQMIPGCDGQSSRFLGEQVPKNPNFFVGTTIAAFGVNDGSNVPQQNFTYTEGFLL